MPIASKLVYFQRRPSPAPPDDPGTEPPDPRRRPCHDHQRRRRSSLSSHHKPGQEHVPGHQRDAAAKPLGSSGNIAEQHAAGMASNTRLHRCESDHGRLPDAVQQARERLLQRLNSVDLSGRRQKTWPSESFWAGLTRPADAGVSTSSDGILASLTNCFQPGDPVSASKVEEGVMEPVIPVIANADECTPITVFPKPVSELQEAAAGNEAEDCEAAEASSPAECSICLERCGDSDSGDGLIQLRCRHVFHSACLDQWLRSRADCPYCRATVRVCS